ncbi:Protein of unknown function (DUF3038) [Xenococcus sp. PCC 7305]|uniref:DUF3038 domain-containing protein n=1 Tax=Xenococcus sp. PCC 7305 TaxID=102125 RepID=UPI0002AC8145|nr:DUF3038 domain-containing protein [Xenococcus sp. PCC 7305]ELS01230.1 Protein of unknown function (DUF3038) [Xenococcus sp. PCC 7305]
MGSHSDRTPSLAIWQDFHRLKTPTVNQLDNIKSHLDLVILALEAIANITSDSILNAAQKLDLESIISDRVALWRLRQSNPLRNSSGGRKKLDVEEARSLVLIICYLAQQEQELLRRAVSLLEQIASQNKPPHQTALLGDYLDKFINLYQERMELQQEITPEKLSNLALKLLVDLLFYSGNNGHRLLWLAILNQ